MTYQGACAPADGDLGWTFFEVSAVRLRLDGNISEVMWVEVNPASDLDVNARVVVPQLEVIDAIHDGACVTQLFSASDGQARG